VLGALFGGLGLVVAMLAGAAIGGTPSALAAAGDPAQVSFTLEGCRNDGTIILPDGSGKFICPDADYTSGNLGKGWNELDLVPYRLTADAGNSAPASQTYTIAIVVDNEDAGAPGYDVLSVPVLNTALSDSSCQAPTVTSETILAPGLGGIDESRYRLVTITQAKGTSCVYDYYARLALGSHEFPGSALHANLANQNLGTAGIGARDVSIPVKEILPQEISKDMSATQGTTHPWDIVKSATPATISFGDTCAADPSQLEAGVDITVTWTRLPAVPSGSVTIITHIYATNPASRIITVNVTDVIRSGTTALDTANSGPIDVPANTASFLVLTHQTTVPAGTTDLNDIATATYTDKVTGVPVPGSTTATASATVQLSGPTLNQTATVNDVESLTGAGFLFSADSFAGASGSFDGGYGPGTATTGPVSWTSASQSGSGSVTFSKTIYASPGTSGSAVLFDTATLQGADGFTTSANAEVQIQSSAKVKLTITKTIPNVLGVGESETFFFSVSGPSNPGAQSISFAAGETSKSLTIENLDPGSYTVTETSSASGKWNAQPPQTEDISLPACSGSVTFNNTFNAAHARVSKATVPAGGEAGWEFLLNGPGANNVSVTTNGAGYVAFPTQLQEGSYTITEVGKAGYDQTGSSGECSFSVNYPADAGREFSCTYTNTQRGTIIVRKLTVPAGSGQSFGFTPSYASPFSLSHGQSNTSADLAPGTYSVGESVPAGWDLTSATCDDGSAPGAIGLEPGETVTCTFVNTQRAKIVIVKNTVGGDGTFSYTGLGGFSLTTSGGTASTSFDNQLPGTYAVSEVDPTPSFDFTSLACSDPSGNTTTSGRTATIALDPGETVTCTYTNTRRGTIIVEKQTNPDGAAGSFSFSGTAAGSIGDNGQIVVANLAPGTYTSTEADPRPDFDLTGIACDDGGSATASSGSVAARTATFKLDPGETVKCVFTNTQRGSATVVKTVGGQAPTGSDAFQFQLRQGATTASNGTTLDTRIANASNAGTITFSVNGSTKLVPGTYQLCEFIQVGWKSSIQTAPGAFVPGQGGDTTADNTYVCVPFTLAPGQEATFTIDNTRPPGGMAKTIGFWKNWASCAGSNGRQKPILDQTLALAGGHILIGDLDVDTCKEAVALLNKSTLSGKKMASDPAFNLAAQLMAYRLNIAAGAGDKPAANAAATQAQGYLAALDFNGITHKSISKQLAVTLNSLAATLDSYNNNTLP
jgi:hypothetical protein